MTAERERDEVLRMLGVDPKIGPLGYWRSHEIHAAMEVVRGQLRSKAHVQGDLHGWWLTADEDRAVAVASVGVPDVDLRQRDWAVGEQFRSRSPYVPIAAMLHALQVGGHRTLRDVASQAGFADTATPWMVLELLDPVIEERRFPEDLEGVAAGLRLAMTEQPESEATIYNPIRWLLEEHGTATWETLSRTAKAASERRRAKLEADRVARAASRGTERDT